jgi:hypothetical protein
MKYKAGDCVRIKSLDWYNRNKDDYGSIYAGNGFCFWKNMVRHCGEIMKITIVKVDPEDSNKGYYFMENSEERWTDEMIEGLVEDTDERLLESAADACKKIDEMMEARYQKEKTYYDGEQWSTEFECPDGNIFKDENGNVINATKIVLEKKKKEYPTFKNLGECKEILGEKDMYQGVSGYKGTLLTIFQRLLIFRDAYWKIAGDWKPKYPFNTARYVIANSRGFAGKVLVYDAAKNYILEFPTEEMRDAFYENFKELIEQCKELL